MTYIAISGLHVSILLGISLAVSQHVLGRRRQLYLAAPLVLMWLYALLSGASPSAVRACIMGTVYLAALFFGRPRSILPALGLAAAVMVAVNPDVLWSVSFQLSFAAMTGIALLTEPVSQWIQVLAARAGGTSSRTLSTTLLATTSDLTAMTVAATVATLPLVAFYFQRVSLVGLPGTLLVMPALPFALVSQALAGLIGLLDVTLAQPFGWLAWAATAYISGVVGLVARIPGASIETGRLAPLLANAYYAVFVAAFVITRMPVFRAQLRRLAPPVSLAHHISLPRAGVSLWIIAPAVGMAALVWTAALARPDSGLHVAFVDVGQGDAAFIVTPDGQQIIVDGGPDPLELTHFLGEKMTFNDRTIELVVLTHAHSDHVTGLIEVLRRYDVQRILEREVEYDSPSYQEWRNAVEAEGADVIQAQAGQSIALDNGVHIQVLNPPDRLLRGTASDTDNASVVLRLVYGELSFLLTGDAFSESERLMTAQGISIDSDVLKVAHHGSRSSSTEDFIASVSPAVSVISAGRENRFNHPHAETIETLHNFVPEDLLFLTADNGTIEFITDGSRLEIKAEQ